MATLSQLIQIFHIEISFRVLGRNLAFCEISKKHTVYILYVFLYLKVLAILNAFSFAKLSFKNICRLNFILYMFF